MIRSDNPLNNRRGSICVYYNKHFLPLRILNVQYLHFLPLRILNVQYLHFLPLRILNVQYLQECINFEMKIGDEVCNFISLYRSTSQTLDNFETFSKNFELNLENIVHKNPFLVVVIGDFNAKSGKWHCQEKSTFEGNVIDNITSQFGLYQVIKEPTHILSTFSSCIDLIFTSLPNLIIDSGVHSSLHPNCHHQIVYAKFNLEIIYPLPYLREVWHYKDANIELIRRAINGFNWTRAFSNTSVNKKVNTFNNTILNILSNFIPHEILACDDKYPTWLNKKIKGIFQKKNNAFKVYRNNSSNIVLKTRLRSLQVRLNNSIECAKETFYNKIAKKFNDTQKNTKAYWSLIKMLLNNKKIDLVAPLYYDNCLITDFKEKAELFNSFFSKQCSLISNNSSLHNYINYTTEKRLSTVTPSVESSGKIIQNLDSNKAHGHDNIGIRMFKICGDSMYEPLETIFREALLTGVFPSKWKKGNIVPVHKKRDKQNIKNYRPVSLLPICGKIFERLIFNEMFKFFTCNNLISPN